MGTTGKPGDTYKVEVVSNDDKVVRLMGDGVNIALSGAKVDFDYFKKGRVLVANFSIVDSGELGGGDKAASAG